MYNENIGDLHQYLRYPDPAGGSCCTIASLMFLLLNKQAATDTRHCFLSSKRCVRYSKPQRLHF